MDNIEITISGYEKYKGRSDVTHNSWFRLSNRFLEDSDFYDFTSDEKLVWIYILSQSSQKNSGTIILNFKHADKVCGLSNKIVQAAVKKLSDIKVIDVDVTRMLRGRYADVLLTNEARALHNKQDITNITNNIHREVENIYEQYPLKKGRSAGLKKLAKEITTQKDVENFKKAVSNYAADVKRNRVEERFIKHFSTFANEWRDWVVVVPFKSEAALVSSNRQKDEYMKELAESEAKHTGNGLVNAQNDPKLRKILDKLKR